MYGTDVGKSRITTLVTARNKDRTEEEIPVDLEMPKMAIIVKKEVERLEGPALWSGIEGQAQVQCGRMGSQDELVLT